MVLWEITLGTAYFLGLKRTYRLALRIQRKFISPQHPKIREFVQRRTRNVFDVALKVHLKIQERDIEVGRNLGNRILRYLDRMKPDAQIRKPLPPTTHNMTKQANNSLHLHQKNQGGPPKNNTSSDGKSSNRHLFTAARNVWPKSFPTISRPTRAAGNCMQYRQYATDVSEFFTVKNAKFGLAEVLNNDVKRWNLHQLSRH